MDPRTWKSVVTQLDQVDPTRKWPVLICAGPPCWDFTRIKQKPLGHKGQEGAKFDWVVNVVKEAPLTLQRKTTFLIENVVMDKAEADRFSEALGVEPILADAADFSCIRRPRLWWSNAPWNRVGAVQKPAGTWNRLIPSTTMSRLGASDIDTGNLRFHRDVLSGKRQMPCLTTPAPTPAGRSAPTRSRRTTSAQAKDRWENDNRQFAPWHYEEEAMLVDDKGSFHLPPAEVKEQLQGLPKGYTRVTGVTEAARHRLLANAWHLTVAKFLMHFVLLGLTESKTHPERGGNTGSAQEPTAWGGGRLFHSTDVLEMAATRFLQTRTPFGPPTKKARPPLPSSSMEEHLAVAIDANHPLLEPGTTDPTAEYAMTAARGVADLRAWRMAVVDSVARLRRSLKEAPSDQGHTNHMIIHTLLDAINYPDAADLAADLANGFPVLGYIKGAPGWKPRPTHPYISREQLVTKNKTYVQGLHQRRPDELGDTLLKEILEEVALGRMEGPFQLPEGYGPPLRQHPRCSPMMPCPTHEPVIALAFPIIQSNPDGSTKIRRGEDWRRSHHNEACTMDTAPHHHGVDAYVDLIKLRATTGNTGSAQNRLDRQAVWGHDHDGAYRQLRIANPNDAFCWLPGDPPTLWRHNRLLFGSAASVWAYNRVGDAIVTISRVYLLDPTLHYVDDFGGADEPGPAMSAFESFRELNQNLGFKMKKSKEQPPDFSQSLLGTRFTVHEDKVEIGVCPAKRDSVCTSIDRAIERGRLTTAETAKLAGRVNFLASCVFGKVGRTALRLLYVWQHGTGKHGQRNRLDHKTLLALQAIKFFLHNTPPRTVPIGSSQAETTVLYADAYINTPNGKVPAHMINEHHHHYLQDNGWGGLLVYGTDGERVFGRVPTELLARGCPTGAYIYFLETWAQLATLICFQRKVSQFVVMFCDNEAAKTALLKGRGNNDYVDAMVAWFWSVAAKMGLSVWLERVPSKANLADPVSRGKDLSAMRTVETRWNQETLERLVAQASTNPLLPYKEEAMRALLRLGCPTPAPPITHPNT